MSRARKRTTPELDPGKRLTSESDHLLRERNRLMPLVQAFKLIETEAVASLDVPIQRDEHGAEITHADQRDLTRAANI
jgi:hypothetical protein